VYVLAYAAEFCRVVTPGITHIVFSPVVDEPSKSQKKIREIIQESATFSKADNHVGSTDLFILFYYISFYILGKIISMRARMKRPAREGETLCLDQLFMFLSLSIVLFYERPDPKGLPSSSSVQKGDSNHDLNSIHH
jgi:hypothetical protein